MHASALYYENPELWTPEERDDMNNAPDIKRLYPKSFGNFWFEEVRELPLAEALERAEFEQRKPAMG